MDINKRVDDGMEKTSVKPTQLRSLIVTKGQKMGSSCNL